MFTCCLRKKDSHSHCWKGRRQFELRREEVSIYYFAQNHDAGSWRLPYDHRCGRSADEAEVAGLLAFSYLYLLLRVHNACVIS